MKPVDAGGSVPGGHNERKHPLGAGYLPWRRTGYPDILLPLNDASLIFLVPDVLVYLVPDASGWPTAPLVSSPDLALLRRRPGPCTKGVLVVVRELVAQVTGVAPEGEV